MKINHMLFMLAFSICFSACNNKETSTLASKDYHREFINFDDLIISDNTLVFRNEDIDDLHWKQAMNEISAPQGKENFIAYVDFVNIPNLDDWENIQELLGNKYHSPIVFLIDAQYQQDQTLEVIDLMYNPGDSFRFKTKHVQMIENNLSIGNLSFLEIKEEAVNGIF